MKIFLFIKKYKQDFGYKFEVQNVPRDTDVNMSEVFFPMRSHVHAFCCLVYRPRL